jgi:uncharacterized RDD family membrane protein YckC
METKLINIRIWRLLAFLFDIPFILLAAFTVYMILGMIFKMDSPGFQSIAIYLALVIIFVYIFFGEVIFTSTLGKYLFGIEVADVSDFKKPSRQSLIKRGILKILFPVEGIVLLFSKSKQRLGDKWGNSIVINKEANRLKPWIRVLAGIAVLVALYFSFTISLGLAAKKSDFYKAGVEYLTYSGQVRITGLPTHVSQSRDSVSFCVPVLIENYDRYALVHLGRSEGKWQVSKAEFSMNLFALGFTYNIGSGK